MPSVRNRELQTGLLVATTTSTLVLGPLAQQTVTDCGRMKNSSHAQFLPSRLFRPRSSSLSFIGGHLSDSESLDSLCPSRFHGFPTARKPLHALHLSLKTNGTEEYAVRTLRIKQH